MPTWTAEFPLTASGGPGGSGTAPDGGTTAATINFNLTNITTVTFQFAFTDQYRFATLSPAGATFKVTSPLGRSQESTISPGQSTATSVTVRELCPVPYALEFKAATVEEAARVVLADHPADGNGTGDWTIEVTVTRDYMTPVHGTGSIAWTVSTRVETYALELSEKMSG